MTMATAQKIAIRLVVPALACLLCLVPVVLAGCGKTTATTTTSAAVETTTTVAEETTTTSLVEETTTTSKSFPPTVNHEEDDSRFVYSGAWKTVKTSSASGKSIKIANASGCQVTVRFYGTGIAWIAKKSPAYGQAKIIVDNGAAETVDLYSVDTAWKEKVWESKDLTLGDHKVVISWTGNKTAGATDGYINVDALVTVGVLTATVEQNASKVSYSGNWKTAEDGSASGQSLTRVNTANATVTVRFNGTQLVWIARTGPQYGQAKVTVDGGSTATVDLYSAATKAKVDVWKTKVLGLGNHTVKISYLGTKNKASSGLLINVDAFRVTGSLVAVK